jgi:hypothetical protein
MRTFGVFVFRIHDPPNQLQGTNMPAAKKPTSRGRAQDRARVAGGQEHEVRYESKKTSKPKAAVKGAIKTEGNSRKRVEKKLGT